jgi:hypothetical protein
LVSRVCEEFQCVPSVALAELDRDEALVWAVLEARGYARAKARYDAAADLAVDARARLMADPLVAQVRDIEFALVRAKLAGETDGR